MDYEDDYEDDYVESTQNNNEESPFDEDNQSDEDILQGSENETIKSQNLMDRVFNTEELLYHVEKAMLGYQKLNDEWVYSGKPLARTAFIAKTINSLRSIINSLNIMTSKETEEINVILLEKAKEFTFLVFDEESIEEEDVESILNIHDHALQMFMGIVEGGRGNSTLRQIASSLFVKDETKTESNNGIGVGWDGKNLIKIGGKI